MKKTNFKRCALLMLLLILSLPVAAQKTVREYVENTKNEKIKKKIVMPAGAYPQTAGGYRDGHGPNPLLTSREQLPDTVALVSFHIYDIGTSNHIKNVSITYYMLSEAGGNEIADAMLASTITRLKQSFKQRGVVLLTPDEFLNTKEKQDFYYNTFEPKLSRLGKFLSGIETKNRETAVTASGYRALDIAAAADFLRAESLGGELARNLGVGGVLSIGVELMSDRKTVNMNGLKMTLHGPNPIPREDKRYISQNMGAGYYEGQIYANGYFYFDKSLEVGRFSKGQKEIEKDFGGLEVVFELFVEKFYEKMYECIEKAAGKYKR